MTSIVLELQRAALDPGRTVSSLLRHAKVVARKLGVADFEAWVDAELNGYKDEAVPEYRRLRGEIKAYNPYHGWIPVMLQNAEHAEGMTNAPTSQALPIIEDLLSEKGNQQVLYRNFPPTIEQMLMRGMSLRLQPVLHISASQLQGILESVRNLVLDWALKLEEAGVLGENMTFSNEEKEKGRAETHHYQIQNQTVIHGMSQSQVQQGTSHSTQTYQSAVDLSKLHDVMDCIKALLPSLKLAPEQESEAKAELATLEAQKLSPKPKTSVIRESLHSLRTILESAAGGAAGNALPALIDLIHKLL